MAKHHVYSHRTDSRVELQWQRGDYAQIGTTRWAGDGTPVLDREFLDVAEGEPPVPAWDGQFVDLDRDSINHLIKQLRIARDQAFGRDE
jgi:hypothetical protein